MELKDKLACRLPPSGWYCTRGAGHDGPCAVRTLNVSDFEKPERPKPISAPPLRFHECDPRKLRNHSHQPRHCRHCDTWYCWTCVEVLPEPTWWQKIVLEFAL